MKGFQIYFEAIKSQLQSKLDVVVSVIHFMLVNDDFLCVGTGEEFEEADASGGSELLPTGWNSNQTFYTLKYRSRKADKLQLLFKGIVAGDVFIASALPLQDSNTVHSLSIRPEQFITNDWNTTFPHAFVNGDIKPLENLLRKEMFDKLRDTPQVNPSGTSGQQAGQQQGQNAQEPGSGLREQVWVPPPQQPYYGGPNAQPNVDPLGRPVYPRIGQGDLDPFGRGGGMLFDPFRPAGGPPFRVPRGDPTYPDLPPGAVPPGARYDPIGPPKGPKGGTWPPNPDHLPPPGGPDPFL